MTRIFDYKYEFIGKLNTRNNKKFIRITKQYQGKDKEKQEKPQKTHNMTAF